MNKDRDALLSLLREARNYLDANLPTNIYAVRREGLGLLDRIDSALAAPAESEGDPHRPPGKWYAKEKLLMINGAEFVIVPRGLPASPAVERQGWRPIESAPRDGTEILLQRHDGQCFVGHFSHGQLFGPPGMSGADYWMTLPSHTVPLPTAPVQHASDCAVHNEPAYPEGPCDCGAMRKTPK